MDVRVLTLFDIEPVVPPEPAVPKKSVSKKKEPVPQVSPVPEVIASVQAPVEASPALPEKKAKTADAEKTQGDKIYHSIGEIARIFGVRTSHIRFWTVQFSLKVRTTRKGDRLYTRENIEQLHRIHQLVKVQGFTIAGAKARLKEKSPLIEEPQPVSSGENILGKARLLSVVHELKQTLLQLRNQIR